MNSYTTDGPLTGSCGHVHLRVWEAVECVLDHRKRSTGSDRSVVANNRRLTPREKTIVQFCLQTPRELQDQYRDYVRFFDGRA